MDPHLLEDDDLKQVANLKSANPPRVSHLFTHPFKRITKRKKARLLLRVRPFFILQKSEELNVSQKALKQFRTIWVL